MTGKRIVIAVVLLTLVASAGVGLAQRRDRFDLFGGEPAGFRYGVPLWENDTPFEHEVFTFVRVRYSNSRNAGRYRDDDGFGFNFGRSRRRGGGGRGGERWDTDYPYSDFHFSYRLQQLTSIKVNPDPIALRLTDDELFDHPFIYMIEPGQGDLYFTDPELKALRKYLLNGGFMMVDDFWGDREYRVFYNQIKRVFPDREPVDLGIEHEIFHCVYDLKELPQVPAWNRGSSRYRVEQGITWEDHGPGSQTPHFRAIYDDNGRMMVFICHNTDIGDGWEREGEDEWYFHHFSENKSYPMGINVVVYAMTH